MKKTLRRKAVRLPGFVKEIISSFKKHKQVAAVYLFGSRAKGKAGPLSDTDLAVFLHPYDKESALQLGSFSSPHVEITIFNEAPPYLKFEIIQGKPLFVRDAALLEHMIYMALKEYHDYVPFYQRQGLLKARA